MKLHTQSQDSQKSPWRPRRKTPTSRDHKKKRSRDERAELGDSGAGVLVKALRVRMWDGRLPPADWPVLGMRLQPQRAHSRVESKGAWKPSLLYLYSPPFSHQPAALPVNLLFPRPKALEVPTRRPLPSQPEVIRPSSPTLRFLLLPLTGPPVSCNLSLPGPPWGSLKTTDPSSIPVNRILPCLPTNETQCLSRTRLPA